MFQVHTDPLFQSFQSKSGQLLWSSFVQNRGSRARVEKNHKNNNRANGIRDEKPPFLFDFTFSLYVYFYIIKIIFVKKCEFQEWWKLNGNQNRNRIDQNRIALHICKRDALNPQFTEGSKVVANWLSYIKVCVIRSRPGRFHRGLSSSLILTALKC